jgi:hypothetical protein
MLVRLNAAEFKSIPRKILPCSFNEIFSWVQPKYRMQGFASIEPFQKGCH